MALPAGITTCTVTLGKALGSLFDDATLSGTVQVDRRLVWTATGDTIYPVASSVVASQSGGWLSFVAAHVDQSGFVDQSGNAITNFSYTFNGRATFSDGSVVPIVKNFQVFVGQSTIDLDLLPDGPATLPVVTPIPPVDNAAVAGFVSNPGPTNDALLALYASKAATYASGVAYVVGQLVVSGTTLYRVTTAHTSSGAIDLSKFAAAGGSGYSPPGGGIPRTDLATDVRNSLTKADASVFRGGELAAIPVNEGELPAAVAQYDGDTLGAAGSSVASWTDDTGTTGPLVQATGGNQPKVGPDLINGHKYARFSGGNYFLSVARSLAADFTIVFVGRPTAPGGNTVAIGDYLHSYSGLIVGPSQNANNSSTPAVVGWAIYRISVKAGLFTLYRNGLPISSGSAGNMTTLFVGRDSGANFYSDWDIAHVRIYSGNLVPEDGVNVDGLLGRRYAISVSAGTTAVRTKLSTSINGQTVILSLPENRTGQPLPLLVVNHGGGGNATVAYGYPGPAASTDSALALGFAVLSADLHGNSSGNATQLQDQRDALTWALTQAPIGRIVLMGISLGGLPTLTAIRKGTYDSFGIPVVGALLIYPVVDIINGYLNITHAELIAAYGLINTSVQTTVSSGVTSLSLGVSYASGTKLIIESSGANQETVTVTGTPTGSGPYATPVTATTKPHNSGAAVSDAGTKVRDAGFDPSDAPASAFGNKRYRVYASDGDNAVGTAVNASPFLAKIAATAREATIVKTRGDHGDPSNFNGRDQAQFLLRCLNDPGIV